MRCPENAFRRACESSVDSSGQSERSARCGGGWRAAQLQTSSSDVLRHISPRAARLGPPIATFSAYQLLQRKGVPGETLLERQVFAPIPPDAMRIASGLNQHRHQPWPIFWTHHVDARLTGSTLVLMDAHKRSCLEAMYVEHHPGDPAFRSLWLPPAVELGGDWTSIVSRWTRSTNYYHWFTDALPRLALLDRLPDDTRVIVPDNLQPFQRETLDWLGLSDRYRESSRAAPEGGELLLQRTNRHDRLHEPLCREISTGSFPTPSG